MYHYAYDREPRDVECPMCGEDAYETVISIDRWGGEFHIKCDHCGLDVQDHHDSPDLEAEMDRQAGY